MYRREELGRIAVITEDCQMVSYEKLIKLSYRATSKLESRKLAFLMVKNNLASIVFYIGAMKRRIVPMLLHHNLQLELFKNLIGQYAPGYAILPFDYSWDHEDYEIIDQFLKYVVYRKKRFCGREQDYPIFDQLAILLSTSGSTGSAKCVRLSYENIRENTKSICQALNIQRDDRAITTLPMDYTYGLSIINSHLLKKACIVLNEHSMMYQKFWNLVGKYKCTTFGGVPYTYEMLIKLNLLNKLQGLRYITQAGGKLNEAAVKKMCEQCSKQNVEFIVMYGQTEATARMSVLPWKLVHNNWGSIGSAIPGVSLYLINENGEKLSACGIEGEIVCEGKNVSLGYAYSYEDLALGDVNNGIWKTGDIAVVNENGLFSITGRKKRIIKLYGNRVNLDEMETYLKGKGFSVVCVEKREKLYVVFFNSPIDELAKIELVKRGIPLSGIKLYSIDELPIGFSGKIDYFKIKEIIR